MIQETKKTPTVTPIRMLEEEEDLAAVALVVVGSFYVYCLELTIPMMIRYFLIFLLVGILNACGQVPKNIVPVKMTTYDSLLLSQLDKNSKNKKIKYAISTTSKLPYRLEINDMLAEENSVPRPDRVLNHFTWSYLDNYILGNGDHKAKYTFYPHEDPEISAEDGMIHQSDLDKLEIELLRYEEYDGEIENITIHKKFIFTIPNPVSFTEQEIEFTIKDLPYKIKGWSESQDLRDMDSELLRKEVVAYYQKLRNILNEGLNYKYTYELQKTKYLEVALSVYLNKEEYVNMLNTNATDKITKNIMYPIENYRLVIEGNGRLVKLYRTDTEFLNWDALIYEDEEFINSIAVRLHKPQGCDTFEIITK
ncbi:hypothetical protein [Cellulophaga sp. Z1A5H]|uniref:hypothetical protein n=1 Tax=Cellulophaga sp. Z1A5H TaxID=2687291 RepID=UPI0013FE05FB|nr:hypothetical protein [Cellulophaga sp. Z1A5H]